MSIAEFETLKTQGGILSLEFLHTIAKQDALPQSAESYHVPAGLEMHSEISRAWTIGRALSEESSKGTINGKQFALKFLANVLGFEGIMPVRKAAQASEEHLPTHLAQNDAVAIVIAPTDEGLDRRQDGLLVGRKIAPFNLAQIHLNNCEEHLWGIAADGATLRLLRDSTSMTRAAFIEADLNRMLQEGGEGHYSDFKALYLLAHASRFLPVGNCILEQWHKESIETGIRAHAHLRNGVEKALEALGTGFLRHASNSSLKTVFPQSGSAHAFYQELLWLAYRMIFLLVTEDRGLIQPPETNELQKTVYSRGYSMSRLRERATRPDIADDFDDLWEGVKRTFAALQEGSKYLALPAMGGLFDKDRCPHLANCRLSNRHLLSTVYHLSYFKKNKVTQRVNYRDMGADELGSIYESLLELTPRRDAQDNFSFFNPVDEEGGGHERKASGSYYTSPFLVDELVNSALQPVLAKIRSVQELLNLRVMDPACGSGHFLIAAARKMAAKLVEIREIEEEKLAIGSISAVQIRQRQAFRAVISNCICGVDKNLMALNLAKIALWLEAYDGSKPLAFLDHHLQCGDSLLGVLDLDQLKEGIPDTAYKAVTGDAMGLCTSLRKSNKDERNNANIANLFATQQLDFAADAARIEAMPDDDLVEIAAKRRSQQALEVKQSATGIHLAADMYIAAFLMRKHPDTPTPPTSADVFMALDGTAPPDSVVAESVRQCADNNGFFHWWLHYQAVKAKGGFDVVLANPPWRRAKLNESEFFSRRVPNIARAANANARMQLIAQLGKDENDIAGRVAKHEFETALHASKSLIKYYLKSGAYPLTGKGDVNSYSLFSELCLHLSCASKRGRVGIIVPTGISTDAPTKDFFAHLFEGEILGSLYDFENRNDVFPEVDSRFRFCLMTIAKCKSADFVCLAQTVADIRDRRRRISLTRQQLELVNPNSRNLPLYRSSKDCKLTEKIYRSAPILWRQDNCDNDEANHWQVKFQQMFHMSKDSNLFDADYDNLTSRLYEAKNIHQYDHRFSTLDESEIALEKKQDPTFHIKTRYSVREIIMLARLGAALGTLPGKLRKAAEFGETKANIVICNWLAGNTTELMEPQPVRLPGFLCTYEHQIDPDIASKLAVDVPLSKDAISQLLQAPALTQLLQMRVPKWVLGWRDITNSQNEFTLISAILPHAAIANTIRVAHSRLSAPRISILPAIWNSLLINYVASQKLAGSHFNYELMKQMPIMHPEKFTQEDLRAIVPLVLELTYTADDLKPFYDDIVAENLSFDVRPKVEHGKPFLWNEVRRANLRAEIDARVALKYNITRDELRYILDPAEVMGAGYPSETFRILQKKELEDLGEFRTRRLVLEAYDRLKQSK